MYREIIVLGKRKRQCVCEFSLNEIFVHVQFMKKQIVICLREINFHTWMIFIKIVLQKTHFTTKFKIFVLFTFLLNVSDGNILLFISKAK